MTTPERRAALLERIKQAMFSVQTIRGSAHDLSNVAEAALGRQENEK
jgi:hypothetical protein